MESKLFARAVKEMKVPFEVELIGSSMEPLLPFGSRIRVDPDCSGLKPGDIVVYQGSTQFVTHRVLHVVHQCGDGRVIQRGDSSNRPGVISIASVVGKVVGVNTPGLPFPSVSALPPRKRLAFELWRTIAIAAGYAWKTKRALQRLALAV